MSSIHSYPRATMFRVHKRSMAVNKRAAPPNLYESKAVRTCLAPQLVTLQKGTSYQNFFAQALAQRHGRPAVQVQKSRSLEKVRK